MIRMLIERVYIFYTTDNVDDFIIPTVKPVAPLRPLSPAPQEGRGS